MDEKHHYLFVYGTLRHEAQSPWSAYLKPLTELVAQGRAPGRMYLVEETRDFIYPAFVPAAAEGEEDASSSWVIGDILRVKEGVMDLKSTGPGRGPLMTELDGYEGEEYRRGTVSVRPHGEGDSTSYECHVYFWNDSLDGLKLIETGDFLRR